MALAAFALFLCAATHANAAELVVSAASSLTEAFGDIGHAWEARHPGDRITFNFAASDVLLRQIEQGAPVDVFASADASAMDKAVAARAVDAKTRADFAGNALVMIVPNDSRLGLRSPRDLTKPEVARVAYGDPASVPAGRYARDALTAAGLWNAVAAKGVPAGNVRQALDYVARGEADAGFVFATDAAQKRGGVRVAATVPTTTPIAYAIAVAADSKQAALARDFLAFVRSREAAKLLAARGFTAR